MDIQQSQEQTVAYLSSPKAHDGQIAERIDTHLSHVFLTPAHVFKLKRAVTLNFVDYGTCEQRRVYCEREISANKDWAGELYKGVLPIWRAKGRMGLGAPPDDAEIVDWVVHMARFADKDRGDWLIADGRMDKAMVEGFADGLAERHAGAITAFGHGGAAEFASLIDQVGSDLQRAFGQDGLKHRARCWTGNVRETLQHDAALADMRAAAGRVRRCHGDLHLRNLAYWDGALIGFDALEFSDDLTAIDTLYDAAFPIMDLVCHGRSDLANMCFNRYLAMSGDYEGLALFPVFLSLRAAIRALTSALAGDTAKADSYLTLAEAALASRNCPFLVAIGGRSGTGKSSLAQLTALEFRPLPGAVILRSDVLRKRLAGLAPEAAMPGAAYGKAKRLNVYKEMSERAATTITAGYTCILDATFLEPETHELISSLETRLSVTASRIWLDAPAEVLRARISGRGKDASDADLSVLERQFQQPSPRGWTIVDASGSLGKVARAVRDVIMLDTDRHSH